MEQRRKRCEQARAARERGVCWAARGEETGRLDSHKTRLLAQVEEVR
jgi:hypothetical protein